MNIRPLRNKVAVKQVDKEDTTSGGIVLVGGTGVGDTPEFGVVAIGPEVEMVKVGDHVYIELGKATLVDSGTLVIEETYITAVLEND